MYVCMYVYIYIYNCICIYIYIYIYRCWNQTFIIGVSFRLHMLLQHCLFQHRQVSNKVCIFAFEGILACVSVCVVGCVGGAAEELC